MKRLSTTSAVGKKNSLYRQHKEFWKNVQSAGSLMLTTEHSSPSNSSLVNSNDHEKPTDINSMSLSFYADNQKDGDQECVSVVHEPIFLPSADAFISDIFEGTGESDLV